MPVRSVAPCVRSSTRQCGKASSRPFGSQQTLSPYQKPLQRFIMSTPISDLSPSLQIKYLNHSSTSGFFSQSSTRSTPYSLVPSKAPAQPWHYWYLFQKWLEATDKGGTSLRICDFLKAFDRIDHNIVLNKLLQMGIHPVLIDWIANFLTIYKSSAEDSRRIQLLLLETNQLWCSVRN